MILWLGISIYLICQILNLFYFWSVFIYTIGKIYWDKAVIYKKAAVAHISWKWGIFYIWLVVESKIDIVFASFYDHLRVTLSKAGVLWDCLFLTWEKHRLAVNMIQTSSQTSGVAGLLLSFSFLLNGNVIF